MFLSQDSHGVEVKMLELESAMVLTGARGFAFKMVQSYGWQVGVGEGGLSSPPGGHSTEVLEYPCSRSAGLSQSEQSERERELEGSCPFYGSPTASLLPHSVHCKRVTKSSPHSHRICGCSLKPPKYFHNFIGLFIF